MARRAVACAALVGVLAVLPVAAQGPDPGVSPGSASTDAVCPLTLDELNELTGLRFVSTAPGPSNCTYDSDIAEDPYTLDIRVVAPDPTAVEQPEDRLLFVRILNPDGTDTSIGERPAWVSPDGVWVDIGDEVLVVQPILFLMADPPDATAFLVPVAELALARLLAEVP
jgi:hypothetical protein